MEKHKYEDDGVADGLEMDSETNEQRSSNYKGGMNKVSIVNNWTDYNGVDGIPPKQIQISDYRYAFVEDDGYGLFVWSENGWGQVSDLTELRVWEYQEIKSYAVAIGWINEDEDLFI